MRSKSQDSLSASLSAVVAPEDLEKATTPSRLQNSFDWSLVKPLPPQNGVPPKEWEEFLLEKEKQITPRGGGAAQNEPQLSSAAALSDVASTYQHSVDDMYDTIDFTTRPALLNPEDLSEKYPTEIECVFRVKEWSIAKSNDHEFCKMEAYLELHWFDYRVKDFPKGKKIPEEIWRPEIIASYGVNMEKAEKYQEVPRHYSNDRRDGKLRMDCKMFFSGEGVNLGAELDRMRAFPFDSVRIDVSVFLSASRSELFTDLQMSFQRPNLPRKLQDGYSGKWQQFQWNCVKHSGDYELFRVSYGEGRLCGNWSAEKPVVKPGLMFSVHLKRTPGFYLQKGILPLYLCAFFSLITFLTEPIDLVGRLQMLFALFLTSFAIQWVTLERLPRLPFNTVLDDVVSHVVVSLMIAATGQGFSYRIAREAAQEGAASSVDFEMARVVQTRMARFDFQIATIIDMVTCVVILVYLIIYSFLKRFRTAWVQGKQLKGAKAGALRPWSEGKEFKHKAIRPEPGNVWRIDLTKEFTEWACWPTWRIFDEKQKVELVMSRVKISLRIELQCPPTTVDTEERQRAMQQ
ncbi:unnamed protein product [Amoebophrya sp. A120]|nr:unnamed protein product [Amoebophrya sp. A120]|eukprot:GSA120T00020658001.1